MKIVEYKDIYRSQIITCWNMCLPEDPITEELFIRKIILDDNFDPQTTLVAIEDEKVIGFIHAFCRKYEYLWRGKQENSAWISVLFVVEDYRNRNIGTQLINSVEQQLNKPLLKIGAASPHYFMPGAYHNEACIAFFKHHGFKVTDEVFSMEINPIDYNEERYNELMHRAAQQDMILLPFKSDLLMSLLDLVKRNFSPSWYLTVKEFVLLNKAANNILLLCTKDDHVIGFVLHGMEGNPERFGPIGIDEKYRNFRWGELLYLAMLRKMKADKLKRCFFYSTDERAKNFYLRGKMKVIRTFVHMEKQSTRTE